VNHLADKVQLVNRYFAMRHGKSIPNAAGVVVSDPQQGRQLSAGLSDLGRVEVARAAAVRPEGLGPATHIICSGFSRAFETGAIVSLILGSTPPREDVRLRERHFGILEGGPVDAYQMVWEADAVDGTHRRFGVESPEAVLDRTTDLVSELERTGPAATFLLVSHGDVLQTLQCGFAGLDPGDHRRLAHLATAEIRELILGAPPS
jgi:broad specificity phosphatase PhoE